MRMKKITILLLSISTSLIALGQKQTQISPVKSTGCSVVQETGDLDTGYPSDYTQYQGMDNIFIPANECWSINRVKANFLQNVSANTFDYLIEVYTDSQSGPGMVFEAASYSGTTDYTSDSLESYTTGFLNGYTKYQLDMNLAESVDLCGGPTGKTYWVSIFSSNTDTPTRTIWEIDTAQAANYGLDLKMYDPASYLVYTAQTTGDFVFELGYRSFSVENTTACNSYEWMDGITYTNSIMHKEYLVPGGGANGCDSVVFLNLTIKNSGTSIDTQTACDSYTWIDGNTYTTSNNTAQYVVNNGSANGCDSIITLNLTITPVTLAPITETEIGTLELATTAGYQYQWMNCTTNQIIPNETSAVFTASENGSYAVIVTNAANCTDTSACFTVDQLGMNEHSLSGITLYPNPTTGQLFIEGITGDASVEVYDLNGKLLLTEKSMSPEGSLSLEALSGKVFMIKILENGRSMQQRVVKL